MHQICDAIYKSNSGETTVSAVHVTYRTRTCDVQDRQQVSVAVLHLVAQPATQDRAHSGTLSCSEQAQSCSKGKP